MTHNGSTTRVATERTALLDAALPGWRRWIVSAALVWALGYGAVRASWAVAGPASSPSMGADLLVFRGWWSVGLCAASAAVVLALRHARWFPALAVAGWGVAAALVASGALLLLDVVGLLLPGIGTTVDPAGFLSRAVCVAGGTLVGATTLYYQRYWRGACLACGGPSDGPPATVSAPPRWAWVAAWAAVAGCLVRLLAQTAVGFGSELVNGGTTVMLFETGFLLAGTVLPLALVHRWGRVFPGWLPGLGGRRVPRWLVLVPALGLGVGMTAYFGFTLVQVAVQTFTGTWAQGVGSLPLWFFWLAVPAYLVWGLGLASAGLAYQRATRPPCRSCGEGS